MNQGKLFIVATPIGNLKDITQRALETFNEVDEIFSEHHDQTKKLLMHYQIKKPVSGYLHQSLETAVSKINEKILSGKNIALVSDAGTPGVSDPGSAIIRGLRLRNKEIDIIPIPGVSALTAMISMTGTEKHFFSFFGFPPQKKGRNKFFKNAIDISELTALVFFESPHRIIKTLDEIETISIANNKDFIIYIGRELTKMYEDFFQGKISEARSWLLEKFTDGKIKGEIVFILEQRQK